MCNKHVVKWLKCQFQCTVCLDIKLTITHEFSKYYQCSVKSSLNCSICIDFHMITNNINAKISSNNNTNPKLWINDFMILNFRLLEHFWLLRYSFIVCIKGQHLNSLIFTEFAWKTKHFAFVCFLHLALIFHHFFLFSTTFREIQRKLMQFGQLLP